ncbi:MAG: hypothetical protein ABR961_03460 [Thermoanaerobaculaceae bacterium]|jgi:hypothetical protein
MKKALLFLAILVLLALPVVAVAQTLPAQPNVSAVPALSSDPIGYVSFYWPKILVVLGTIFGIARVVIRYAPTPPPGATGLWPMIYVLINHAALPTTNAATPAGKFAGPPPGPPTAPPPAATTT